jgi:hypothetical protein
MSNQEDVMRQRLLVSVRGEKDAIETLGEK